MSKTDIGQISVCLRLRITEGKTNDTRKDDQWKSSKNV